MHEPVLAIAAPAFGLPSETFIDDHVRGLAPGRTVLICRDGRGAEGFGAPVLSNVASYRRSLTFGERLRNAAARRLPPRDFLWTPRWGDRMRLRDFLIERKASVGLAEYGHAGLLMVDEFAALGLPLHVHFHGFDANALPRQAPAVARLYRRMFPRLAGVIVGSEFMRGRLEALGCPPERLRVRPLGIDPLPLSFDAGSRRLICVARLVKWKGVRAGIRVFARLHAARPDLRLDIVGEGPERAACEAEAAAAGVAEAVVFHGAVPNARARELIGGARLMLHHCLTLDDPMESVETFGVAVVEAMSAGLPVLATRHGALPETLADGETAILVEEGDEAGMAAAAAALLDDPDRSRAMGEAGRARVLERYTHAVSLAGLRRILELPDPA